MIGAHVSAIAKRVVTGPHAVVSVAGVGCRRIISLTYDDGPNPHNTQRIVELLDAYDAKATFFVIGHRIQGREEILQNTAASGHELGNHTFSHVRMRFPSRAALQSEIVRTQTLIKEATNVRSALLRPPFGKSVRDFVRAAQPLGLETVLWSVDPRDWDGTPPATVVERTLARVEPGSIVLLHDGGPLRPNVLAATEELARRLTADGYELVTVSELIATGSSFSGDGFCQSTVR